MSGELDLVFDARYLAPAWLSASLASSNDPKDLLFYRTMQVEFHPHGVRMASCDRYMLLWAWAPALDMDKPAPDLEEPPLRSIVVRDVGLRAKALVAYAKSLIEPELDEPVEVTFGMGDAEMSSYRGMQQLEMDGLAGEALELEVPDREKVRVGLLDADTWPNWRSVFHGFVPKRTMGVAIAPSRMRKLADLALLHGDEPLVWRFGGSSGVAMVEIGEPPVEVHGGVMPVRWNYGEEMEQG